MGNKILLADDSITIQKVIELTFSDEDFEVVTVGNGRLAIEKVQEVRPDVVLCDVIMPENNGYEVCDFVKKSPGLAHIPVLLLTGAFEPFDQERAARVGCDGFLAKPFEPETLIARVKDLLAKAATPKAPARPVTAAVPPVVAPASSPSPVVPAPAAAPFAPVPPPPPPAVFAPEPPPSPAFAAAPAAEPEMAFIPDEPFEDLETPVYLDSASASPVPEEKMVPPAPAPEAIEELVPLSAEESESLTSESGASTVMFRADSLPWPAGSAPVEPVAPAPVVVAPSSPPPAPAPVVEQVRETTVFEEVIEEDDGSSTIVMSAPPVFEAPPVRPEPPPAPAPPAPAPPVFVAPPAPPPLFEPPAPPPVFIPAPAPPAPVVVAPPPPVVMAAPPPPPPGAAEPEPPVVEAPSESSFADVAAAIEPPLPEALGAPSVAGQVEVPVDMVSQIAQRVVAQVSEKMVERIAWEVIPDLAEALIKREIERLKAELKQLG